MTYVAILVLMLAAFSMVGWPLISSSRRATSEASGSSPWDDLIGQRDAAYAAIKELDFEYDLGNLSDSDYRDLRDRYRSRAASILQSLETAMGSAGGSKAADVPAAPAPAAPTRARPETPACPSCGQSREAEALYCWSCGARLDRTCSNCDRAVKAGDRFCVGCGADLEAET